jgi:cytochrome c
MACHEAAGTAALGPSLRGVFGRRAGSVSGFAYSKAMKGANFSWDEKTLAAFLADPQSVVPGNRMPFPGVPDARERQELVSYLKQLK